MMNRSGSIKGWQRPPPPASRLAAGLLLPLRALRLAAWIANPVPELPGSCGSISWPDSLRRETNGSRVYVYRDRRIDRRPWVVARLLWADPSASWGDGSVARRMPLQHVTGLSFGIERCRTIWGEFVSSTDFLGGLRVPFGRLGSWFGSSEATIAQWG